MSRNLGRDVPDLEKLDARKLWAEFLFLRKDEVTLRFCDTSFVLLTSHFINHSWPVA